ncbi:MAG: glycosyltransferase, partial [Planctomycetota bacterium]
ERNECGYGCKQGDLDEYVEKLLHLFNKGDQLSVMGEKARQLAEKEFNRDIISNRILALIEKINL